MTLLSHAKFAKLAGVTRQAIYKAVKSGNVRKDGTKIDTEDPFNREYLQTNTRQKSQGKLRIAGEYDDDGDDTDIDILDDDDNLVGMSKQSLEKRKLREVILLARVKREQLRGTLILMETMREAFMKFYAVLTGELHPLGDKISQDLAAAYGVDDEKASATAREIVDDDVFKALAHIQRLMSDYSKQKIGVDGD